MANGATNSRCAECPTRRVCLAADLPADELGKLATIMCVGPPLAGGEHVYHLGDAADRLYHVRSGVFKGYAVNRAGDEHVTGFYYPGDLLGSSQTGGRYAESAVALETGTVCALPVSNLDNLAGLGLSHTLVRLLGERDARVARHQRNLNQKRADVRLAGWLTQISEQISALGWCGSRVPVPMSRTDLASHLGMTLESLSRACSKLEKSGVIDAARDHIDLMDRDQIRVLGQA